MATPCDGDAATSVLLNHSYLAYDTHTRPRAVTTMNTPMDIDSPWMFAHSKPSAKPPTPALALARAGGPEGTTYLYQLDDAPGSAPGYCSTSGAGAKRWV